MNLYKVAAIVRYQDIAEGEWASVCAIISARNEPHARRMIVQKVLSIGAFVDHFVTVILYKGAKP